MPNKYKIAGAQIMISIGTIPIIKLFRLSVLTETTIAQVENRNDDKTTEKKTPVTSTFAARPIIMPAKVPMISSANDFAPMYSLIFTGVTESAWFILWLFSRSIMAPIKNRPIAAGSVKIKMAPTSCFAFSGIDVRKITYKIVKNRYRNNMPYLRLKRSSFFSKFQNLMLTAFL